MTASGRNGEVLVVGAGIAGMAAAMHCPANFIATGKRSPRRSSTMPTAVMTESSENTMSRTMICAMTPAKDAAGPRPHGAVRLCPESSEDLRLALQILLLLTSVLLVLAAEYQMMVPVDPVLADALMMTAVIVDDLTDTPSEKNQECTGQGIATVIERGQE